LTGGRALLLALTGLMFSQVFGGPIALQIEPDSERGDYVVTLRNQGPDSLAVVGRNSRTDSFVTMTFSLRGSFVPATRTSEKMTPYLVLLLRLASGERMLHVHPAEMAKYGALEAAYEDGRFVFSPAQEYLFHITLPQPPVFAEVHLVDAAERRTLIHARWRAEPKGHGGARGKENEPIFR
jgi:hypothetical protein